MNNTQKALIDQEICEQITPNLGITQSSGLDHHAVFSRQRVDLFTDGEVASTQSPVSTRTPPIWFTRPVWRGRPGSSAASLRWSVNGSRASRTAGQPCRGPPTPPATVPWATAFIGTKPLC